MSDKIFMHYDAAALDLQFCIGERDEWDKYEPKYKSSSARARRTFTGARYNIPYGDSPNERLDIFPAPSTMAPVVIYVHGGYWRSGDMALWRFVSLGVVGNDVTLVLPTYDIGRDIRVGIIVEQVRKAFAWTVDNIADYGGDPAQISVSGHSAGGQLAAMLLTTDWGTRGYARAPIRSATLIGGLFDLEPIRLCRHLRDDYGLDLNADEVATLSPYRLTPQVNCPVTVVVGAEETQEYRRSSRLLATAWQKRQVAVTFEEFEKHHHFSIIFELADPQSRLSKMVCGLPGPRAERPAPTRETEGP